MHSSHAVVIFGLILLISYHPTLAFTSTSTIISLSLPIDLWQAYENMADTNSLFTDMVTASGINILSDSAAQATSLKSRPDLMRTTRFASFGILDGGISHGWFLVLDAVVGEDNGSTLQTIVKVVADATIYTPLFCVWFLAAFVILEGKPYTTIPMVIRNDFIELVQGNLGFFLPITGFIYRYVPRDERVLAFGMGSLIYTTALSLWNDSRGELCVIRDEGDDECIAIPAQARPLLSIGMRRAIVKVKRFRL